MDRFAGACHLDWWADDATIDVIVHPSADPARFTLTEYTGTPERHVQHTA